LISVETLEALKGGGTPDSIAGLDGQQVSVGIWPDGPIPGLERMTTHIDAVENGVVKIVLINEGKTVEAYPVNSGSSISCVSSAWPRERTLGSAGRKGGAPSEVQRAILMKLGAFVLISNGADRSLSSVPS